MSAGNQSVMQSPTTETPSNDRKLGLPMTIALVVGNMIGAGIFLLPAELAPFGRTAFYGWLVTIAGVLCLAATFMILSARMHGGPYAYVRRAFGPMGAFLIMWAYLVGCWAGLPAIAVAGTSYFSHVVPALGRPFVAPIITIAFIWMFVAVNVRGARSGGTVQLVTSVLKVLPLIAAALVAAAMFGGGGHAAEQSSVAFSGSSLAAAATLALFSMLGFECPAMSADKIRDPERNVPLATLLGTILTGFIYIIAYAAVLFLLSGPRTAASPAPFADAIEPLLGSSASTAIALFAAVSALGCVNGWILVSGEVPLTLARDGVLPHWFAKTTPTGTPVRALLTAGAVSTLLVASNYTKSMSGLFAFSALVTTVSSLFVYAGVSAAAIALGASKRIRSAILPFVAVPGLLFALWAFWGAGAEPSLWGVGLLASGIPVYWLTRRRERSIQKAGSSAAAPVG